jgi:hypothetical protein
MDCSFLRQTIGERVYTFVYVCHLIAAEETGHSLLHIITAINYVVPLYYLVTVWPVVNMFLLSNYQYVYSISETVAVGQPIKKLPAFCGNGMLTSAFTTSRKMLLISAKSLLSLSVRFLFFLFFRHSCSCFIHKFTSPKTLFSQ